MSDSEECGMGYCILRAYPDRSKVSIHSVDFWGDDEEVDLSKAEAVEVITFLAKSLNISLKDIQEQ